MSGERAVEAFRFFTERGWSPEAASAIVGPMYQESRFNTAARNPGDGRDGSDSIGLNQWNGTRAKNLQSFARVNGYDPGDLKTQLAFTDWELNNDERRVGERLRRIKSPEEGAWAMAGYHRPAGWTSGNPSGAHGFSNRLAATRDIYRAYQSAGNAAPMAPAAGRDTAGGPAPAMEAPADSEGWEDVPSPMAAAPAGNPDDGWEDVAWEDAPQAEKSEGMAGRATRAQRESIEQVNPFTAAMRGAAQGASFGFGDEASGLAAASGSTAQASQANARAIGLPSIPSPIDMAAGAARMGLEKLAPSLFGNRGNEAYVQSVTQSRTDLRDAQSQQPVSTIAGQVAGGLAVPVPGSMMATPGRAAATGAGMAGAYGIGEGETSEQRIEKGLTGAAIGGPLGYATGRFMAPGASQAARPATEGQQLVEAAERVGVTIPRGLASDNRGVQATTQAARSLPGGGQIERAVEQSFTGLDEAAQRVAAQAGGRTADEAAPTALRVGEGIQGEIDTALAQVGQVAARDAARLQTARGTAPTMQEAGGAVRNRITANVAENNEIAAGPYQALEAALPLGGRQPERATETVQGIADGLNRVIQARAAAGQPGLPPALGPAIELATRPEGVTFAGLQRARQALSEQIDFEAGRGFGTGDLRQIYGQMTGAMRDVVGRQGGERALSAFDAAEAQFAAIQGRNAELTQALRGKDEGFVTGLISAATQKTGANAQRFQALWRELGDPERQTVANAIYGRLGREQGGTGEFSLETFVKNWTALSGQARSQMFGRQAPEIDRMLATAQGSNARSAEYARDIIKLTQDAPEKVVDRLLRSATSGGGEDFGKLARAVTIMGPKATQELADSLIGGLGRHNDAFSPRRFANDWGNVPDSAKRLLIPDAAHRASLDDIAKISGRMAETFEKFANKSGTARAGMLGGAAPLAYMEPTTLLASVVAPNVMARILSRPASSASAAKWAQAYEVAVRKPTAATATVFDRATKNFAATVGDKAGVPDLAGAIMHRLSGPHTATAEDPSKEQL